MDQPTAGEALRRLDLLVGAWVCEAVWPDGKAGRGGGRESCEWLASDAELQERRRAGLPEAAGHGSVTRCDAANGTYFQLYADERDVCRVYEMSFGDGEWRLWREGQPFSQRFVGRFSDDGNTITARWEIAEDGVNYSPDFDLVLRRAGT